MDMTSKVNDDAVDIELNAMLSGMKKHDALAQASAANSALALLSMADFRTLDDVWRARMTAEAFKLSAYLMATTPVVQQAVAAARGVTKEEAIAAIARALGSLFGVDPEPTIRVMLGIPIARTR